MPRLSIVIPCLGGAADFDGTLVSVLQHRPADCEVLVVHSEPYSDPYRLAGEVTFVRDGSRSLVGLVNAGIERAAGDIVHVLACGIEATEAWTDAAVAHFADPDVMAVSPAIVSPDGQLAAAGVRWSLGGARHVAADSRLLSPGAGRQRARIVGPTLAAAFYRRDALAALDGFDPAVGDRLADVDLALTLRSLGGLHVCEPASRLVLSGPVELLERASGFAAGRAAERVFWRYAAQRGTAVSLAMHSLTVSSEAVHNLPGSAALTTLLGRAVTWLEIGSAQRHQQRLALAAERLAELAQRRATIRLPSRGQSSNRRRQAA